VYQYIPRMTSKSTMSNSMRITKVTFWETITMQFLYSRLAMTESPFGVETVKGYKSILGQRSNSTTVYGVIMESTARGSNNA